MIFTGYEMVTEMPWNIRYFFAKISEIWPAAGNEGI